MIRSKNGLNSEDTKVKKSNSYIQRVIKEELAATLNEQKIDRMLKFILQSVSPEQFVQMFSQSINKIPQPARAAMIPVFQDMLQQANKAGLSNDLAKHYAPKPDNFDVGQLEENLQEGLVPTLMDIGGIKDGSGGALVHGTDRHGQVFVIFMYSRAMKKLAKHFAGQSVEDPEDDDRQQELPLKEETPPGREDQVKKLKKELPATYTDSSGKTKESNPWAVAWASYNKGK